MNPIYRFLNGKVYNLDGVQGIFYYRPIESFGRDTIEHQPTPVGKQSAHYAEVKRQLRDDWSSDLTHSERVADIAVALGYRELMTIEQIAAMIPADVTIDTAYDVAVSIHPRIDGISASCIVADYRHLLPEAKIHEQAIDATRPGETPEQFTVIAFVTLWQLRAAVDVYLNN